MDSLSELLQSAAQRLSGAKYPAVLTGAGISAESGIPTFRGEEGLWKNYRAEELATPGAFARDPELVWEWYNWRRSIIAGKSPNEGHRAIVALQKRFPEMPVITQNVDGYHGDVETANLIEMHGNIFRARCLGCGWRGAHKTLDERRPLCASCGGALRPDIVWFGESLDAGAVGAIMGHLQSCDLLLVVGTSGVVYPAAGFASQVDSGGGAVVEVNPDPVIPFAIQLKGKSGEILSSLLELI